MDSQSIEIRGLYKIFGARAHELVAFVQQGLSKDDLNREYSHVLGLKDINITIPGGRITVIMGLSGSGKSTLIRHINRLVEPTAGEIIVGNTDILRLSPRELRMYRRNKTAMVFQKFALLPHRTVLDNALYGLELQGLPREKQVDTAMHWLSRVGLQGYEKKYPNQLSGGMQQRVGLARALANDAEILLMDEAYSALDPLIRVDMQTVLLDLQKELRKTVVFITHDLDEALRLGDKIAILRDGQVVQQGTAQEIVLTPADDYIMSFVQHVNRSRVVEVEAVMEPVNTNVASPGCVVCAGTVLEEAGRIMLSAGVTRTLVADQQNRPIGSLTLEKVLAAMVGNDAR